MHADVGVGRRIKRYLLTGIVILAPISVTLILLLWFVSLVDYVVGPIIVALVGYRIPGLGVITAFVVVFLTGFLSTNILGRQLLFVVEELFLHIPVLNFLYRTAKQMTEAFSSRDKMPFKSLVMIEHPGPGVRKFGFLTNRVRLESPGAPAEELAVVYVPTNHLYLGEIVLVQADKMTEMGLTGPEGIQFFLSAGASLPRAVTRRC